MLAAALRLEGALLGKANGSSSAKRSLQASAAASTEETKLCGVPCFPRPLLASMPLLPPPLLRSQAVVIAALFLRRSGCPTPRAPAASCLTAPTLRRPSERRCLLICAESSAAFPLPHNQPPHLRQFYRCRSLLHHRPRRRPHPLAARRRRRLPFLLAPRSHRSRCRRRLPPQPNHPLRPKTSRALRGSSASPLLCSRTLPLL